MVFNTRRHQGLDSSFQEPTPAIVGRFAISASKKSSHFGLFTNVSVCIDKTKGVVTVANAKSSARECDTTGLSPGTALRSINFIQSTVRSQSSDSSCESLSITTILAISARVY